MLNYVESYEWFCAFLSWNLYGESIIISSVAPVVDCGVWFCRRHPATQLNFFFFEWLLWI